MLHNIWLKKNFHGRLSLCTKSDLTWDLNHAKPLWEIRLLFCLSAVAIKFQSLHMSHYSWGCGENKEKWANCRPLGEQCTCVLCCGYLVLQCKINSLRNLTVSKYFACLCLHLIWKCSSDVKSRQELFNKIVKIHYTGSTQAPN